MAQTIALVAPLGASRTGLTIGYRVLNMDRTTHAAFSTTGVVENPTSSGSYSVSGGVSVPDAGGYIVVGVSGTDYAEAPVDPIVTAASVVAAIMAQAVETSHTVETVLKALYAVIRGKAVANSTDPTQIIYYAPDNATARVTHALTDTERTVS